MTPEPTVKEKEKQPKKERTREVKDSRTKITKSKAGKKSLNFLKCPLCLENMKKKAVVSTRCGHVFCKKCLQNAVRLKPTCPICRKKIRGPLGFHSLYLAENISD